jgi:hypothetical protein
VIRSRRSEARDRNGARSLVQSHQHQMRRFDALGALRVRARAVPVSSGDMSDKWCVAVLGVTPQSLQVVWLTWRVAAAPPMSQNRKSFVRRPAGPRQVGQIA